MVKFSNRDSFVNLKEQNQLSKTEPSNTEVTNHVVEHLKLASQNRVVLKV